MTTTDKERIRYLRGEGLGYKAIASRLGVTENAVKGFCKRSGLDGVAAESAATVCRQCGALLETKPKSGYKKYCSDNCRNMWWRSHQYFKRSENEARIICALCGCVFYSFISKERKYCSRACSMKARYGEVHIYDKRAV